MDESSFFAMMNDLQREAEEHEAQLQHLQQVLAHSKAESEAAQRQLTAEEQAVVVMRNRIELAKSEAAALEGCVEVLEKQIASIVMTGSRQDVHISEPERKSDDEILFSAWTSHPRNAERVASIINGVSRAGLQLNSLFSPQDHETTTAIIFSQILQHPPST